MPMQWGIGYDWAIFVVLFAWLVMLGSTIWVMVYNLLLVHGKHTRRSAHFTPNERESLETLRRRYWHGDMGTDTFEQARQQLEVSVRSDDPIPAEH